MRVITGIARGRKLETPPGAATRPTSAMVKEAMFSIVQFEVEGAQVLDLFAGSGQLGIEALSRGAHRATFVENSKEGGAAIRQNLKATGLLGERARIVSGDVLGFLRGGSGRFCDIAFVDPPYDLGVLGKTLKLLAPVMSEGGVILCEAAAEGEIPGDIDGIWLKKSYKYGKIRVLQYRAGQGEV